MCKLGSRDVRPKKFFFGDIRYPALVPGPDTKSVTHQKSKLVYHSITCSRILDLNDVAPPIEVVGNQSKVNR